MPAQRHDAAARTAHVPEQQLNDGGRADVLHAHRVLRPAHGIAESAGPLAPGIPAQRFGDFQEQIAAECRKPAPPSPACSASNGVSGSEIRNADAAESDRFVRPGLGSRCVGLPFLPASDSRAPPAGSGSTPLYIQVRISYLAFVLLPAAEQAIEVFGVAEIVADDGGGVGVIDDVFLEVAFVFEDVANDAAEKYDVACPARMGTWISATALVRVKRGST